jgi:hypothetical protein
MFRLLKKHKATKRVPNRDGQSRVLLNENGRPLLSDESQTDNIEMSYSRVCDKLELKAKKRKPLAALRKTSATLLEHSVRLSNHAKNFTSIVSYFLGQSPKNVAKSYYTPEDSTLLTEAIGWLGQRYRKAGILF